MYRETSPGAGSILAATVAEVSTVVFDSVSGNSTVLAPSAHSQSYMPKKGPSAPLLSNGSCPRRQIALRMFIP